MTVDQKYVHQWAKEASMGFFKIKTRTGTPQSLSNSWFRYEIVEKLLQLLLKIQNIFFRNDLPSGKMSQWCLSGPRPDQIRPHDAELNVRKSENKKRRNRKEQNSKLKYKFGK